MFDSSFRFILNSTSAVATNSYIMLYPKDEVSEIINRNSVSSSGIWKALRSISRNYLESQGRVYARRLKKIEPRKLSEVRCEKLFEFIENGGVV